MSNKRIFKKLEEVNSAKNEICFSMSYKDKIIHKKIIEIPEYASDILNDDDLNFYYFFKEIANKLEDKINEIHKKKMWDDLKKIEDNAKNDTETNSEKQ